MSRVWTLLRMNPLSQDKFIGFVKERIPDCELYIPQITVMIRPHGRRKPLEVLRPCFPGYVFARPDLIAGEHIGLTRTPVRTWYVRFGRYIEVVPDTVIEQVRGMVNRGEIGATTTTDDTPKVGQSVVVSGWLLRGIVLRLMGPRVEVEVGNCRVIVVAGALEAI